MGRILVAVLILAGSLLAGSAPASARSTTVRAYVQCATTPNFVGAWVRNLGGDNREGFVSWNGVPAQTVRIEHRFADTNSQGFYIKVGCGGTKATWLHIYRAFIPKSVWNTLSNFSTYLLPQSCGGGNCIQNIGSTSVSWTRLQ